MGSCCVGVNSRERKKERKMERMGLREKVMGRSRLHSFFFLFMFHRQTHTGLRLLVFIPGYDLSRPAAANTETRSLLLVCILNWTLVLGRGFFGIEKERRN